MLNPKKILVFVSEELLGDALLKLPFIYGIKEAYPQAELHWWVGYGKTPFKSMFQPLVEGVFANIKESAFVDKTWKNLWGKNPFREEFFHLIIDTQRDLKITLLLKRIPHDHFVSATHRYFFSDFNPKNQKPKSRHLSDRLLFLLEIVEGKRIKSKRAILPVSYIQPMNDYFSPKKKYVGLAPGAGQKKKCWPLDSFIAVAHELVARHLVPVFVLGPQECSWHTTLKEIIPEALFPLQDHPAWLQSPLYTSGIASYLACALSNDSGSGHLMVLGKCPMVSLFGPTAPDKSHPYADSLIILRAQDYGTNDISSIPVEDVLKRILEYT